MADSFENIKEYVKYLRTFPLSRRIFLGSFYSFVYDFDKENKSFNEIKYYDLMPLVFITGRHEKYPNLIQGINFHHMPLNVRNKYIEIIKTLVKEDFEKDKRLVSIARYDLLVKMFRKATKIAVRNYYIENISDLRKVENSDIEKTLKYYANTYYGINISNMERNYIRYAN
jgi:hypothetical protein